MRTAITEITIVPEFSPEILRTSKSYSFLNFASLGGLLSKDDAFNSFEGQYFCDGWSLALTLSLLTRKRIKRASFDYTSLAPLVFSWAELNTKSIYIIGAKPDESDAFRTKLLERYPALVLAGSAHGYQADWNMVAADVVQSGADIVVVGLGAGLQEEVLAIIRRSGFRGVGFTCGGFIRQMAVSDKSNDQYYPTWINALGLRAFYRMYKEPHTIRRYAFSYSYNLCRLIYSVAIARSVYILTK